MSTHTRGGGDFFLCHYTSLSSSPRGGRSRESSFTTRPLFLASLPSPWQPASAEATRAPRPVCSAADKSSRSRAPLSATYGDEERCTCGVGTRSSSPAAYRVGGLRCDMAEIAHPPPHRTPVLVHLASFPLEPLGNEPCLTTYVCTQPFTPGDPVGLEEKLALPCTS